MCVETVRQYTCGCEELEEVNFCELLLQPENGHYANGQRIRLEVVQIEMSQECEECAALAEQLIIAQAKTATTKEDESKGKDGEAETAGITERAASDENGGDDGDSGSGEAVARGLGWGTVDETHDEW